MAGGMTTYQVHAVLNAFDTGKYLALFTAAPSDAGGGTELSGSNYSRQALSVAAASARATSNDADITFGPASGSWGTITHVGIFDASTSGNLLWWSSLSVSKTVTAGESFKVPSGDLDLSAVAS